MALQLRERKSRFIHDALLYNREWQNGSQQWPKRSPNAA